MRLYIKKKKKKTSANKFCWGGGRRNTDPFVLTHCPTALLISDQHLGLTLSCALELFVFALVLNGKANLHIT